MTATDTTLDHQLIDTTTIDGNFVGVYTLRTFVGVNLNADMDGKPKQIVIGNTRRLRVSSQSLKRAQREWTHQFIGETEQAVRTRKLPQAVARALADGGRDFQEALAVTNALFLGAGKFTVNAETPDRTQEGVFAPTATVPALAQIATTHWDDLLDLAAPLLTQIAEAQESDPGKGRNRKTTKLPATTLPLAIRKEVVAAFAPGASIEIALAGRMLTALPSTGAVDAAMSVASGFSVDPVVLTLDQWSTKDEWQDDGFDADPSGSSMLDTRTLASGTVFQWSALDRRQLRANLASSSNLSGDALDEAARTGEQLFVSAAAWAVPSAASHSTGSMVAPELAAVTVSDTPPLTPPVFTEAITDAVVPTAANRIADYLTRAHQFRPINGGRILWMPGVSAPLPQFPDTMTEGLR